MKLVRSGAMHGMWAFLAYGVVEALFAELVPRAMGRTDVLDWESATLLLVVYAAAGLILGSVGGAIVSAVWRGEPERALRAAAVLALVLLYAANAAWKISPVIGVVLPLGTAFLAFCAALLSLQADGIGEQVGACFGYWSVAFLLVVVPAASKDLLWYQPWMKRTAGSAVALAGVMVASYVTRSFKFRPALLASIAVIVPPVFFFLSPKLEVPGPAALGPSPASGKPNVVLVVLDTVRADHLSLYGYARKTTPQIEKLAAQATLYTNAVSASDMTLASHASLFTGMYPTWHQAHFGGNSPMGRPLAGEFRTLAEILADRGYFTVGVGSNTAFLQHAYGLDQGFSIWSVRAGFFQEKDGFWLRQGVHRLLKPLISPYKGMSYRRAGEINADVFRMLDAVRGSKRPFFLFVNYMDAHWPYDPPRPFDALYPHGGPAFSDAAYTRLLERVMELKHTITDAERTRLTGPYDGAIAYLDSQVGRLVEQLKARGLYENTLLIITADHGETFGERNLMSHSVSVYQDQVRVPLVVKYPNTNRGAVAEPVVSGVDLMPTVLETAGCPVPEAVQGENLLKADSSRDVLAESFPNVRYCRLHSRFLRMQRAIFHGSQKLVTSTTGHSELFDTAQDPHELHDLSAAEAGVAARLQSALDRSLGSAGEDARKGRAADTHFEKTEVERLKSLGYVQ